MDRNNPLGKDLRLWTLVYAGDDEWYDPKPYDAVERTVTRYALMSRNAYAQGLVPNRLYDSAKEAWTILNRDRQSGAAGPDVTVMPWQDTRTHLVWVVLTRRRDGTTGTMAEFDSKAKAEKFVNKVRDDLPGQDAWIVDERRRPPMKMPPRGPHYERKTRRQRGRYIK